MSDDCSHKASLVLTGLTVLAVVGFGGRAIITANNLAGLRTLTIQSYGDVSLDVRDRRLLTAIGDYTTYTVPLRSGWEIIEGENLGYFPADCDSQETCEFLAGDEPGEVVIRAEANGFSDDITLYISAPTAAEPVDLPFSDVVPGWANSPVHTLNKRNIITGYNDGRFGAGDQLTRGQLVTIFYRTLLNVRLLRNEDCQETYSDVPPGHYAYQAACQFRNNGWTDRLSTFHPDEPASRGETAALLNRVVGHVLLHKQGKTLGDVITTAVGFNDVRSGHPEEVDIAVVSTLGLMRGDPDGTFRPAGTLNRAEAATIFFRLMEMVEREQIQNL